MYGREVLIVLDDKDTIIEVNEGFNKILGYNEESIIGNNINVILEEEIIKNIEDNNRIFIESAKGSVRLFDIDSKEVEQDGKMFKCLSLIDITSYGISDQNKVSLKSLYDNAKDIIYIREMIPERKFIYLNNAVTKLLGYKKEEVYKNDNILESIIHPKDLKKLKDRMIDGKGIKKSLEVRVRNKMGEYIWFEDICIPTYDKNGKITLVKGISRCIQERKVVQSELEEQIYSDSMTKLKNRKYLEDQEKEIEAKTLGLIMLDLDNLKEVNDKFGHLIGDELILAAANIFKRVFKTDIKARFGGDEFIIVVENATKDVLNEKLKKLDRTIEKYNKYSMLQVSLSKGCSIYHKGNGGFKKAIEEADYNMYKDKRMKKSKECERSCLKDVYIKSTEK